MDFDQPATDSSALLSQSHTACEITLVRNMCTVVNFYHFGNSSVSVLGKAQFSFEGRFRFRSIYPQNDLRNLDGSSC